ncbi:MAG: choice-of-anchor Q domain-containing protein [bacterium]
MDAGDPDFTPPPGFDQRGDPFARVFGTRIDMGAYERQIGDMDFDGDVGMDDIDDVVFGLRTADDYEALYAAPPNANADGDGDLDFDDILGFVRLLGNGPLGVGSQAVRKSQTVVPLVEAPRIDVSTFMSLPLRSASIETWRTTPFAHREAADQDEMSRWDRTRAAAESSHLIVDSVMRSHQGATLERQRALPRVRWAGQADREKPAVEGLAAVWVDVSDWLGRPRPWRDGPT